MRNAETWRPVARYEGRYEVSDLGRVRSLSEYRTTSGGVLKPWVQNRGYQYVSLRSPGGVKKTFAVHRLVLEAFVGPCPNGCQCAHGDGDPTNNRVENLRWASAAENIADRTAHGRTYRGEGNASAKLDRFTVKTIKQLANAGISAYAVARLACVHPDTIERIWRGETWSHI
ncbi:MULTISPECIES: NUMOD4 motif-containing HNH endonuclease [Achromobacter]